MLPDHLSQAQALGWTRGANVHQYELGRLKNFVYLIACPETHEVWIVDPREEWKTCENDWIQDGYRLSGVLLTHTHHDHVGGLATIADAYPKLPLYLGREDAARIERSLSRFQVNYLEDQQNIPLGTVAITAVHTPGHSPGEYCYLVEGSAHRYLLTGDTLFIRDSGRTDLPGGSDEDLFLSLNRIRLLPTDCIILPGHHYVSECASTLARELETNAPLRAPSLEALKAIP